MLSKNISETRKIAKEFMKNIKPGKLSATIIALNGDLGSGKTVFVKAAAKALGLKNTVTSPTFVIEKIYKLKNKKFKHLIHIDAYRLESGEELKNLGWNEILGDSGNIIFIEWADRVSDILSADIKKINFTFMGENEREIKL